MKSFSIVKYIIVFISLVPGLTPVYAHHSLAAHYDVKTMKVLEGTLTSVTWRNPHSMFEVEITNSTGNKETWSVEAGAINTIRRQGIDNDSIQQGDKVTITGLPARSGQNKMVAAKMIHDGTEYVIFGVLAKLMKLPNTVDAELGYQTSAASYAIESEQANDVFRVWTPIQFPGVGVHQLELPLTQNATKAAEDYDQAAEDLAVACVPPGMPSMLDQPYPIQIIDEGDHIVLYFEEWNAKRFVAMNDTQLKVENAARYGNSKGHWQGDTLVIETTNIDYPYYDDAGTPMTTDMVVTERYELSEDRTQLLWSATVVDPNVFTEPVTMNGYFVYSSKYKIQHFKC